MAKGQALAPSEIKRIKHIKEFYSREYSPEDTCFDEYYKRRMDLTYKVILKPLKALCSLGATAVVGGVASGAVTSPFLSEFINILLSAGGTAALDFLTKHKHLILRDVGETVLEGMIAIAVRAAFLSVGTNPAGGVVIAISGATFMTANSIKLHNVQRMIKLVFQAHRGHGDLIDKLLERLNKKTKNRFNLSKDQLINELVRLDLDGSLCDGSLVKKGRLLKQKLVRRRELQRYLINLSSTY
jgi:hypothetical protein